QPVPLPSEPAVSERLLFTSESVSMGHPDKVADQISDAVLDFCLKHDPTSRVACETLVTTNLAIVAGEITTQAPLNIGATQSSAPETIKEIGYTDPEMEFTADTCNVISFVHAQSPHISMGVDVGGAGDQGMMFGFACNETPALMPLPIHVAHRLVDNHADLRRKGTIRVLRPDAKSQVTVEYPPDGLPYRFDTIVLSTQHDKSVMVTKNGADCFTDDARQEIIDKLIAPALEAERPDLIRGPLVM